MIGLAEGREYRTRERGNDGIERLRLELRHFPFAPGRRAIPDHGGCNRVLGRVDQRMPAGLAVAADRHLLGIGGLVLLEGGHSHLDQLDRFRIAHVVAGITGIQNLLIGMPKEEIGRQHGVAVMRAAHRLVPGMLHQAITLVHQDDRRKPPAGRRIGQQRRHSVAAGDLLGGDVDVPGGDRHSFLRARIVILEPLLAAAVPPRTVRPARRLIGYLSKSGKKPAGGPAPSGSERSSPLLMS